MAAVLTAVIINTISAMPPNPRIADEYTAAAPQQSVSRLLSEAAISKDQGSASFPAEGTRNVLILVAGFSDADLNDVSTASFYDTLFEEGPNNDGFGWKQYYRDMSNGKLTLNFDVYVVGNVSDTHDYYGENTSPSGDDAHPGQFVAEAVALGDTTAGGDIDYSKYDNDGDGYVDAVIVIHQGQGEEYTGSKGADNLWSHRWDLYSSNISDNGGAGYNSFANDSDNNGVLEYDGVLINDYAIQPEYLAAPGDTTIGVFVHEFRHILGLVDLYDTSYTTDGIGDWGLMSSGAWLGPDGNGSRPAPLCAWSRERLGWLTVENAALPPVIRDHSRNPSPSALPVILFLTAAAGAAVLVRKGKTGYSVILVSLSLISAAACSGGSSTTVTDIDLADVEVSYKVEKMVINDSEYLLAENKVKKDDTWTEYLSGQGLLIYHVDNGIVTSRYAYNTVNDYSISGTLGVAVIEADGNGNLLDPDDFDSGSATDPFYHGNKDYLDSIRTNSGGTAPVTIDSIGDIGDVIPFRVLREN